MSATVQTVVRTDFADVGENWHATYYVDGLRVPLFIHKSITERMVFGSEEFWEHIERSAIAAAESWLAHPEWRISN